MEYLPSLDCFVVSYLITTCCPPFSTILTCLGTVCNNFSTYCPSILKYHSTYCLQNYGLHGTPPSKYMCSPPSKHCSTGTIPAQYRGYCRNGTGPPLFYCHLRNSDLPFCTSAFYRSGTGKLLLYRYQPAQLHYIASPLQGDKVSMLTHIYPHKPWRNIEVTICKITRLTAHFMCGQMSDLLICTFL